MNRALHPTEQEEVMAYLDGELSADRAAVIAAHLRECADCEALAASLRGVSQQTAAWRVESSPARMTTDFERALSEYNQQRNGGSKRTQPPGSFGWRQFSRMGPFGWTVTSGVVVVVAVGLSVFTSRYAREASSAPGRSKDLVAVPLRVSPYALKLPAGQSGGGSGGGVSDKIAGKAQTAESNGQHHRSLEPGNSSFSIDAQLASDQPLIARTATLSIEVKDFASVEGAVKAIAARHNGYIADLNVTTPQGAAQQLNGTLRIPSAQLEAALAELKQLGRAEQESQNGVDVTAQYADLAARLKNSRITEQRLLDLLRERTGKMKDILETEQEIERVRGEIEQMEAEQRGLQKRIDYATIQLSLAEDYKASLETPSTTGTRLHNATVEGFRTVVDGSIAFVLWMLEAGPTLLLWAAILFFPARWAWTRWRHVILEGTETAGSH
jgi:hypothetical protein